MKLIDLLVKELPKRGGWPEGARETIEMHMDGGIFFDGNCAPDEFTLPQCSNGWAPGMGRFSNEVTRDKYESALAKNDGWIEWGGGERPVEEGALVDVRFRDGDDDRNIEAIDLLWNHENWSADIIAYRLHKPDINSLARDDRLEHDLNECIGAIEAQAWDGCGLPPVGIKCEFTNGPYSVEAGDLTGVIPKVGGVVDVVAHRLTSDNNPVAVVYWDDNGAGRSACFVEDCFLPLRTEAEKAREEACRAISHILDEDRNFQFDAKKIYDAIAAGKVPGVKLENK